MLISFLNIFFYLQENIFISRVKGTEYDCSKCKIKFNGRNEVKQWNKIYQMFKCLSKNDCWDLIDNIYWRKKSNWFCYLTLVNSSNTANVVMMKNWKMLVAFLERIDEWKFWWNCNFKSYGEGGGINYRVKSWIFFHKIWSYSMLS